MKTPIHILIVENQTLTRVGIETILNEQNDIEIVGEAETSADGLRLFEQIKPDVTILSLRLPDSCAVDEIENYLKKNERAKIIVLADHAGDAEISRSLKNGAFGYVCQDVSATDLVKAIRTVHAGKKYLQAEVANVLNENIGQEELTKTERKILQAIVAGKANKEIAFDLNVSENTVKTHVKNVFGKLGVSDRTSAATLAIRRGLVRVDL
ncbi:MAG TPA: response regulator transcription factor [Pyrinomonadaceae bacterium]|jgi:DNA-binding NarL/FixJ family response regulator|nr:response regulator transcription factor [Pyrinomonadaceae bacterium]